MSAELNLDSPCDMVVGKCQQAPETCNEGNTGVPWSCCCCLGGHVQGEKSQVFNFFWKVPQRNACSCWNVSAL